MSSVVSLVSGRALPLRGNDIDTDRIIPARFLRCVTFDGLGQFAFEDDRKQLTAQSKTHPFDDRRFAGASVLVVNSNFGCGSSREHAPQAIAKWGIRGIVGVSFSEIFFGNCVAMGLPCLRVSAADAEALQGDIERDPAADVTLDLAKGEVRCGKRSVPATMAEGPRKQFLTGQWDALGQLVSGIDEVRAAAKKLPYVGGFA
ncbi:MAG: 3-isopropylmalate dehydratase small subunit [Planctomycetes bacterium]|nr:3-isopropylmalate dehydratase small subunit [Planctomycetota bacterium]